MAFERRLQRPRRRVPYLDRVVGRARRQPLPVGREGDRGDPAAVAFKRLLACVPFFFNSWL